jgi:hypothetical protein
MISLYLKFDLGTFAKVEISFSITIFFVPAKSSEFLFEQKFISFIDKRALTLGKLEKAIK